MSAKHFPLDWRYQRAAFALQYGNGKPVDLAFYAGEFDLDEDETRHCFERVALALGVRLAIVGVTCACEVH